MEDHYGAGGRAFLNVNMPGYDILDGAIDGGLDPECEFELELRLMLNKQEGNVLQEPAAAML